MTAFWSAVINGAILGALLSGTVWFGLWITPRRVLNAATRYAIWWLVLGATLALPLSYAQWRTTGAIRSGVNRARDLHWEMVQAPRSAPRAIFLPIEITASQWLRSLLILWIVASLLLLLRVFLSYIALYRRSARATAAPQFEGRLESWLVQSGSNRKPIRIAISSEIDIPIATGPFRATVLLPSKLLNAMSDGDLHQIGLHEAAHLARYDDYALFAQRILEAVFALHPLVRWLTRQIDLEREIACDDIVVSSTEHARSYADCLTRAVTLCGGVRTSLAAANVADSRSHLSRRVELLLKSGRGENTGILKVRWAMIAVALIGAAALLARTPLLIAFAAPQAGTATQSAQPEVPHYKPAPQQAQSPFEERRAQGLTQLKARQFDAAIAAFQDLLSQTTDLRVKADLWALLGEAYRYKGDFAGGIAVLEQAFQRLPGDASIATKLALLYDQQKDSEHARQYYEKAIAIDPNNPLALNNLAYVLTITNGDTDLALTYAREAQQKLPSLLEVNDTIGWIYLKKNWIDDAIGSFRILTEQAPQIPEYHYHLALALYQQGSLAEAMEECKTALTDTPALDMEKDIHELIDKIAPESDVPLRFFE